MQVFTVQVHSHAHVQVVKAGVGQELTSIDCGTVVNGSELPRGCFPLLILVDDASKDDDKNVDHVQR